MSLPKPYYEEAGIVIYNSDCSTILPYLEPVDLVLTDPPYGLGDRLHGGKNGEWSKGFETAPHWDASVFDSDFILSLMRKGRDAVIWGGNYYPLPPQRGWLAWDKMQEHSSGHFELAWTTAEMPTRIFRLSRVEAYGTMDKQHPTQKPEKLIRWCLSFFPNAQTILDPFMGSGTTLRAAKDLGRKCIGIEISREYCDIAIKRLQQEVLPL